MEGLMCYIGLMKRNEVLQVLNDDVSSKNINSVNDNYLARFFNGNIKCMLNVQ